MVTWPRSSRSPWRRQGLNPDLQLQGSCSDRPHRTRRSSLSGLQTVAECVLYYYLTKKNENYKSLVRRSYRRRGKSQVRDGTGWLALGARPPRASRPFTAWVVTICECGFAAGSRGLGSSVVAGRLSQGVIRLPWQQRGVLAERPLPFSAWKVLELRLGES